MGQNRYGKFYFFKKYYYTNIKLLNGEALDLNGEKLRDSEDRIRTLSLVAFCPVVYVRIFFRFVYTVRLQMIQLFNSIIMRPRYTP